MNAQASPLWSDATDDELRDSICRQDLAAASEAYRRHGAIAYQVAVALTGDDEQAQQAVVAAFGRVTTRTPEDAPTLRAGILDEVQRCACDRSVGATTPARTPLGSLGNDDVLRALPFPARSILTLSVVARCDLTEIAAIMSLDAAEVRRTMLDALRHARTILGNGDRDSPRYASD